MGIDVELKCHGRIRQPIRKQLRGNFSDESSVSSQRQIGILRKPKASVNQSLDAGEKIFDFDTMQSVMLTSQSVILKRQSGRTRNRHWGHQPRSEGPGTLVRSGEAQMQTTYRMVCDRVAASSSTIQRLRCIQALILLLGVMSYTRRA